MKKMLMVFIAILLIFTACTPMTQQQRPIVDQQQRPIVDQQVRQNDKPLDTKGDLQTNQSAIYDPGEVRNCRITADTLDVKAGTGNNFNSVGNLRKDDVVKVLGQVGNWYVIQMDNNQIGAIDAQKTTPVVKETDVPRVPQVQPQTPQQTPQQNQNNQTAQNNAQTPINKLSAQEQQMVDFVNQERTKNGLNALIVDLDVARVAGIKSQDMADNNSTFAVKK